MDADDDKAPASRSSGIEPRDIVLHLRSIHFSLLLACVGLYVLVTSGRPVEIDRARAQLAEIVALVKRWDPDWVVAAANESRSRPSTFGTRTEKGAGPLRLHLEQSWTILPLPHDLLDLAYPGAAHDALDHGGPLWSQLAPAKRRDPQFLPQPRNNFVPRVAALVLPAPQTPKDFETMWNALGRITLTLVEAKSVFSEVMGPTEGRLGELTYSETPPAGDVVVSMRLEPIADAKAEAIWRDRVEHEWTPQYHFVGYLDLAASEVANLLREVHGVPTTEAPLQLGVLGRSPTPEPATISMAAQVEARNLDAQSVFIKHFHLHWRPGSYALNFPELSAVAAGNDDLYFDKVTAFIESAARRSEKEVAIFGLSVPVAMVSSWGMPIVLVAQLYFLIHLRSLRRSLGAVAPKMAPWIGVYGDLYARATTIVSVVVLPPVALAVAIASEVVSRPLLAIGVLASVLVGMASFVVLRQVWRALGIGLSSAAKAESEASRSG